MGANAYKALKEISKTKQNKIKEDREKPYW